MAIKKKLREDLVNIFHKYLSYPVGHILYAVGAIYLSFGMKAKGTSYLMTSIRYCDSGSAIGRLDTILNSNDNIINLLVSPGAQKRDAEGRAIILSLPFVHGEKVIKGVMVLTFSHTFSYFISHPEWQKLNKMFVFVLEPSWAGYADADIIEFVRRAEHCVVQAAELRDRALLNSLFPGVPCLDTGASNWIDYSVFKPGDENVVKDIDIIYIANGNPIKRVFRAVDAISSVVKTCPDYHGVIICAGWGGGNEDLHDYIKNSGMSGNIDLHDGMSQKELVGFLSRSKASMMLSLKEGSNRVLFESMFVNVPVICLSENIGVNKSYINSFTGLLVHDNQLAKALQYMRVNYNKYSPRAWARKTISPDVTTKVLANLLGQFQGSLVNNRLQIKVNSPEVKYRDLSIRSQEVTKDMMTLLLNNELHDIVQKLNKKYKAYLTGAET